MDVFAILDNKTVEKISYKFLQPNSKSDRIEILFLSSVSDNIKVSVDKGVKESYVLVANKLKSFNQKFSIWFRGVDKSFSGNSADLAFAIAFINELVKMNFIKTKLKSKIICATGVIGNDGIIQGVSGIPDKMRAIIQNGLNIGTEECILFIPAENISDINKLKEDDPKLYSSLHQLKIIPARSLSEIIDYMQLSNKLNISKLIPIASVAILVMIMSYFGYNFSKNQNDYNENNSNNNYVSSSSFVSPINSGYSESSKSTSKPKIYAPKEIGIYDFTLKMINGRLINNSKIFSGPSSSYIEIGFLTKNEDVLVISKEESWFFIEYKTQTGLKRGYLPASGIKTFGDAEKIYYCNRNASTIYDVDVRSGPADTYISTGRILTNWSFKILFSENNMMYIEYNTNRGLCRGYISSECIKY